MKVESQFFIIVSFYFFMIFIAVLFFNKQNSIETEILQNKVDVYECINMIKGLKNE